MSEVCKWAGTMFLVVVWLAFLLEGPLPESWVEFTAAKGVFMASLAAAFFLGALVWKEKP